ncbi:MAG: hypothetical protein QM762_15140 [Chryseolinea sp.]
MKNLILATLAVILVIYLGYLGMQHKHSIGPFLMFVGVCTSIGLAIDINNAVRERIRKANLRKLGIK